MDQSREAENQEKRRRWKEHIDAWAASGKTQTAYCLEHDLSRHRFQYWKKRLHQPSGPAFIELKFGAQSREQSLAQLRQLVWRQLEPLVVQRLPVTLQG